MKFLESKLKWPLLVLAAGAMVFSAAAQESGQAIIFSSPKTDDAQAVTPSLVPRNSDLPTLPSTLLAPVSAFPAGPNLSGDRMPAPGYSSERQRQKQLQDERRNWTLMTPAEILGVTTTEQMLQAPERDAFGRKKTTTPFERFLDRENQARMGSTNNWRSDRANSPWNLSRDDDNAGPLNRRLDGTADPAQNLSQFLNRQQNKNSPGNRNGQLDENSFDAFAKKKESQAKLEQLATMERFRQMMNPVSAPASPSPNSRFFPVPKPVVDANFTQPDFVPNPAGASFTPLSSSIGKPVGLTPLPGAFTTRPQPAVIPSWKPQPPPWVSQSGLPTAFPQQKF